MSFCCVGDNPWSSLQQDKVLGLSDYRASFVESFNLNDDGSFKFDEPIGSALSRPIGTPFEYTSFAHVHKNALFVTIDAFHRVTFDGNNYFDRENGFGGEGYITCTVTGDHLSWFESVLEAGKSDNSIKHIFVQAHVPVLQPVRKSDCSGQFMDGGTDSAFWKAMRKYGVDVYFPGEVHANTVSKDDESDLLQVVSRGVRISNYLAVDVNDNGFSITAYNEIGTKWRFNGEYESYGWLNVDKSGSQTNITSSGILKVVDTEFQPLIEFDFDQESFYPFNTKQIVGMKHDQFKEVLLGESITIRNEVSSTGMENKGVFTGE